MAEDENANESDGGPDEGLSTPQKVVAGSREKAESSA